jgi:hypothetical protein
MCVSAKASEIDLVAEIRARARESKQQALDAAARNTWPQGQTRLPRPETSRAPGVGVAIRQGSLTAMLGSSWRYST